MAKKKAAELQFEKRRLADLTPASYNPRVALRPGDPAYEKIVRSIEDFGYCDPIIVNQDGTIIGGHQRVQVLKDLGAEYVDVVVVDLDPTKEKALNIALNKITGAWDTAKLTELIGELDLEGYDLDRTGFTGDELSAMLAQTRISPEDFTQDFTLPDREQVLRRTMHITLHKEQAALIERVIAIVTEEGPGETYGNTNQNGNAIGRVVREWLAANTASDTNGDD